MHRIIALTQDGERKAGTGKWHWKSLLRGKTEKSKNFLRRYQ